MGCFLGTKSSAEKSVFALLIVYEHKVIIYFTSYV